MPSGALDSNTEWKKWGEEDPLYGVSTWKDKAKDGASPWTEDEFYNLGRSDWNDFSRRWKVYGVNLESCLEFGCGAGRMTRQLSEAFQRVYAVDVSEGMIRRARQAVGANVEFSLIDGIRLPQPDSSVKAVFSTHVLQHLDSIRIGYDIFREFHRVLDSGGTLMVHLPLYAFPGNGFRKLGAPIYSALGKLSDLRAALNRRMGRGVMRGIHYPIKELYDFLLDAGFKNVEIDIFPVASNGDLHPFVFATK